MDKPELLLALGFAAARLTSTAFEWAAPRFDYGDRACDRR